MTFVRSIALFRSTSSVAVASRRVVQRADEVSTSSRISELMLSYAEQ